MLKKTENVRDKTQNIDEDYFEEDDIMSINDQLYDKDDDNPIHLAPIRLHMDNAGCMYYITANDG